MTKLYGSSTINKLNRFHQKTKWVNSVRKQDLCMLLKLDNIFVTKERTLEAWHNVDQWLVANTLYLEMIQLHKQKDGFKETWELGLYWKSRPVFSTFKMELKFEFGLWIKTILNLGSEFLMERSNMWSILFKTTQKFLQIHKKSVCHKQASRWLQPDQRQKQNHNREYSLGQQQPSQYMKEDGLTLSHQNKILLRTISRRKWSIFFDTIKRCRGKKMEQLNFYKIKFYLRNHHSQIQVWSDDRWKACLAAGGGSKRRYQYCSDNSGTILSLRALQGHSGNNLIDPSLQGNVIIQSGFFHYIFTTLDARSIFILLSTMDWYLEVKIWAEDRQYSSCLLILETKVTKILNILTSLHHV